MKYAWNMGTDIESFNENIIEFFGVFFLDNTGMKISVQLWTSSDDCGKFCYRYELMRNYAKWLGFEETAVQFEQTH